MGLLYLPQPLPTKEAIVPWVFLLPYTQKFRGGLFFYEEQETMIWGSPRGGGTA